MPDTRRPLVDLQALLPDNVTGLISPQDARDAVISVHPEKFSQSGLLAAIPSTGQVIGDTYYPTNDPALYRWNGTIWVRFPFGSGSLALLEQHAAASSAQLAFTAAISAAYDVYQFEFVNVVNVTNTQDFLAQVSIDGGATWAAGAIYHSGHHWIGTAGSNIVQGNAAKTAWYLAFDVINSGDGVNGTLKLYAPMSTRPRKSALIDTTAGQAGQHYRWTGSGTWVATTAINAVRFYFEASLISSGVIRCYGLVK